MNLITATKKSTGRRTWEKRVAQYDAGIPIPESHIVALRSRLSRGPDDLRMFLCGVAIVDGVNWSITQEQTIKGLAWLKRPAVYKLLTEECKKIVDSFSHFTFVGVEVYRPMHSMRESFFPLYRVHSKFGASFTYSSSPWQQACYSQGKTFEVIGEVAQ